MVQNVFTFWKTSFCILNTSVATIDKTITSQKKQQAFHKLVYTRLINVRCVHPRKKHFFFRDISVSQLILVRRYKKSD